MGKNSNFNQALWLAIGQVGTFLITFVSAAILARYFDKTQYGTYKQILYVYNTLQIIFTAGVPGVFSYFIPRLNSGQQKTLVNSLNKVFLMLGGLFSLALFFGSRYIANFLNNPELEFGLKIFSVFPLFTFPTMGVEGIYTALKQTKYIAYYHVFSKLSMLLCIVLPVILIKSDYKVAIIGWGIASFLTFVVAMIMKNKPYVEVKKEIVPNMYRTIFNYSIPLMGASMAGFFITSADQFFISRYYGTETFAVYSNGAMSIPIIGMIAGSVKSVLLPIFSKAQSEGKMDLALVTYNNAVNKCVTIVFPVLLYCVFFSKEFTSFVYGKQYIESGSYLAVHVLRDFVDVFPYFAVLMAFGFSKVYMYWHFIGIPFIYILDFFVVGLNLSPILIVGVSSLWAIILRFIAFYYIYRKTSLNIINSIVLKHVFKISIHCISCLFILRIVSGLFFNMGSFAIILISGVSYCVLLCLSGKFLKINYLESIHELLGKK